MTNTNIQSIKQLKQDIADDAWYIAHIENPPLEVQLLAVKNSVTALGLIKKPDLAVRRYAIRKSDLAYSMLQNPTDLDLALHEMTWEL